VLILEEVIAASGVRESRLRFRLMPPAAPGQRHEAPEGRRLDFCRGRVAAQLRIQRQRAAPRAGVIRHLVPLPADLAR
jgi:hypothetical protein